MTVRIDSIKGDFFINITEINTLFIYTVAVWFYPNSKFLEKVRTSVFDDTLKLLNSKLYKQLNIVLEKLYVQTRKD